eukprot:UN2439
MRASGPSRTADGHGHLLLYVARMRRARGHTIGRAAKEHVLPLPCNSLAPVRMLKDLHARTPFAPAQSLGSLAAQLRFVNWNVQCNPVIAAQQPDFLSVELKLCGGVDPI